MQTQNLVDVTLSGNTSGTLALISSGTLTLAGGNNITLSQVGNAVTISAGTAAGGGIGGIANSQATFTSGTVNILEGGGAITIASSAGGQSLKFSVPATSSLVASGNIVLSTSGSTITISASTQSVQTQSRFNLTLSGNTSGTLALISSGVLTLAGGNNITLSQAGNAVTISGGAGGGGVGIAAGSQTATSGTILFQNSNAITFGMSDSSVITASFSQSVQTQNIIQDVNIAGNTSGTTSDITSGTMTFAAGNNITLSQNGNAITISAGGISKLSFWENIKGRQFNSQGLVAGRLSVQRVLVPANVSATELDFIRDITVGSIISVSSQTGAATVSIGLYAMTGSTANQLSSISAATTVGTGNSTGVMNVRYGSVALGTWNITPGEYLFIICQSFTNVGFNMFGANSININGGNSSGTGNYVQYWYDGTLSAQSDLSASYNITNINRTGTLWMQPWFAFIGTF